MNIDYNDQRFQQVNNEKQTRLNEVNNTYNNMINQSQQYYDNLAKEAENYGNKQQELQQQKTDLAIDRIEQQKDWAKQDYTKEQKGAYQDYAKQVNNYGVNAEQMAQNGLLGTGYAESSRVSMYNAYQNRVATARESYNRAVAEYDDSIKEAQLANNATLAELAHNTLQTKLELALQGFQYKNDLIKTRLNEVNNLENTYYSRWNDVLQQINKEKAFEYQKERDAVADAQWQKQYNLSKSKSSGGSGAYSMPFTDAGTDDFGNDASTQALGDYYFKSTTGADYQPRYINNTKLTKTGTKLADIGTMNGIKGDKNIWSAGGNYYVWDENHYVNVTNEYKNAAKKKK